MTETPDSACWTATDLPGGGSVEIGFTESGGYRHRYYAALPEGTPRATILAVHGFGTTGERTWRHIAPQLTAAGIAVYAPDILGSGESDKPEVIYGLRFFARQIEAFARVLELERPILLGHSMGAKIVTAAAVLNPGIYAGLILVNSGGFDRTANLLTVLAGSNLVVGLVKNDWVYSRIIPRTPFGPLFPAEDSREHFLRLQHSHRALDLDATGIRARLHEVKTPVLVLWGDRDHLMPRRTAHRIAAGFRDARVRFISGAGHAPMKDAPDAVSAEITAFAEQLKTVGR